MQIRDFLVRVHQTLFSVSWVKEWQVVQWLQALKLSGQDDFEPHARELLARLRATWPEVDWRAALQRPSATDFITALDPNYPPRLLEGNQPPVALFYRGNLRLLDQLTLGVVGARTATFVTQQALRQLGREWHVLTVISGLAAGADTFALEYALHHQLGAVAVIASGVDVVYPARNRQLQQQIAQAGLLLSEYPLGTAPMPYRFVARNRIIAGLAHGVLVTEAAASSGSLITANYALQNNREVFAVPNVITAELGAGTNALIQAGAKLVTRGSDVLSELRFYP